MAIAAAGWRRGAGSGRADGSRPGAGCGVACAPVRRSGGNFSVV